jgi:glycosyltransferase involved in cell wall biosynthesis
MSLLAIIESWIMSRPDIEPIIVGPTPGGAISDAATERGWMSLHLPFEGWAVASTEGGKPERKLRNLRAAQATLSLMKLIGTHDVKLVVTNTLVTPWGALAAAATGRPHVWFVREFAFPSQGLIFPQGRQAALRDIGLMSTTVVANSRVLRDELATWVEESSLSVVYPPVDLARVRRLSAATPATPPGFSNKRVSICVVGRITKSKGQWKLIEALGVLARSDIDLDVCFVGSVVDRSANVLLARRAVSLGIRGALVFLGEQKNPFPYLRVADLSVVPTDIEAFGRVTLESLALGKPVITSREGAGAELVVPGETGELFSADSIDELVTALRKYVDDAGLAQRQGAAAWQRAEDLGALRYGLKEAHRLLDLASQAAPSPVPPGWVPWVENLDTTARSGCPRWWGITSRGKRLLSKTVRAMKSPRSAWHWLARNAQAGA